MRKIDTESLAREVGAQSLIPLPRDVSPRQYLRGDREQGEFIMMLYPDANDENKAELKNFIKIGSNLSSHGLKTPEIFEVNETKCYALLEDLGTASFGDCLRNNTLEKQELYTLATDVLIRIRDISYTPNLSDYKSSLIYENRRQIIDYYMTLKRGVKPDEETVREFLSIWDEIENSLPPCPQGFLHGDYHLENLIYTKREEGIKKCALIDYQDALWGPLPYDLVNLIEDARIDVPKDVHDEMIERYIKKMSDEEKDVFLKWFRVLAAQFHGRVIGLFIKIAAEQSRDSYLVHIPRLLGYIKKSLNDPVLEPLKAWFEKEGLDFEPLNDLDGNHIRAFFETPSF